MCEKDDYAAEKGKKVKQIGDFEPVNMSQFLAAATLFRYFGGKFTTE